MSKKLNNDKFLNKAISLYSNEKKVNSKDFGFNLKYVESNINYYIDKNLDKDLEDFS